MPQSFPLLDLHEDLLLHINRRDLYPANHWQTNFDFLKRNQVKATFATAFPVPPKENFFDPASNDMIESDFAQYLSYCETHPEWMIVKTKADLELLFQRNDRHGLILHIEGLNVVSDADWPRLEKWYDMGWRSLGLVWNLTNPLGGGTKDSTTGLTMLGARMIEWLQAHHMVVDFAHMNAPTFADALKIVKGPIVISHGNACALCPNPRNYTDEQLRLVAERGGIVGVFFAKTYLTGSRPAVIEDVV
ncbi:hypothetical protein EXS71_02415, partial [Candidatus Uhrbacteria bacterium]|nr:hypothetical protein [Candidatus Uhrbacteria bacterium]